MANISCQLHVPDSDRLYLHIKENAPYATRMALPNSRAGKSVAICGAGPSLADAIVADTDEVWACNSALPFLIDRGQKVTHGFAIDTGLGMLQDWRRVEDVEYIVASSIHPDLTRHLYNPGKKLTWFHNYLGFPCPEGWQPPAGKEGLTYEFHLYTSIYPTGLQVGHGLNAVPRAICLAAAMGFDRILVYGADCAAKPDSPAMPDYGTPDYTEWLGELVMYADGKTALSFGEDECIAQGEIDGRRWHTRVDMLVSARWLVTLQKQYPHINYVGDTLVNAIREKSAEWWDDMPTLGPDGVLSGLGNAA